MAKETRRELPYNPSMFNGISFSSERKHMVTRVRQSEKMKARVNDELQKLIESTFMSHDAKHFPKASDLINSEVFGHLNSMFITFSAAREQLREHSEQISD